MVQIFPQLYFFQDLLNFADEDFEQGDGAVEDTQRVVAPTGPVLSLGDTCFYLPALTKTGASL